MARWPPPAPMAARRLVILLLFVATAAVGSRRSPGALRACKDAALCQPLTRPAPGREAFAFIDRHTAGGGGHKNSTWPQLDYSTMTTVCVFERPVDLAMVCHAHKFGVRVVMSAPFNVSQIGDAAARTAWVQAHLALVQHDGLDGLNLDIERYTGAPEPLTALVAELYHALKGWHAESQLSFDLSILPAGQAAHYDHGKLATVLDFIVPMAYDEPWNTKVAAANSPIATIGKGIAQYAAAGVPASKLVIGLPWYGWDYPCNTTQTGGVCDVVPPAGQPWNGWATQIGYADAMARLHSTPGAVVTTDSVSVTKHFDYTAAVAASSRNPAAAGRRNEIWFDDPSTLQKKYAECKKQGAHGVAFWTADMPDYSTGQGAAMWQAVNAGFPPTSSTPPPPPPGAATVAAVAAHEPQPGGRAAVITTGDRSLLPSCHPPGSHQPAVTTAPAVAAAPVACVKMGNSEPEPGSWSILPSGVILDRASVAAHEGRALCIAAVSCAAGAALTLHPAHGAPSGSSNSASSSCAVLNGSRIHFPACGMCADAEGSEFEAKLASCTSDGTFGFKALYNGTAPAPAVDTQPAALIHVRVVKVDAPPLKHRIATKVA